MSFWQIAQISLKQDEIAYYIKSNKHLQFVALQNIIDIIYTT